MRCLSPCHDLSKWASTRQFSLKTTIHATLVLLDVHEELFWSPYCLWLVRQGTLSSDKLRTWTVSPKKTWQTSVPHFSLKSPILQFSKPFSFWVNPPFIYSVVKIIPPNYLTFTYKCLLCQKYFFLRNVH